MEGYQGIVPFVWNRVRQYRHRMRQYRFRDTYQQMNRQDNPRRRRKAVIKRTRMGKRSWGGLKVPKLRICMVTPRSLFKRLKDVYMHMVMTLTGKKNSSRLAYGSYPCAVMESTSKRLQVTNNHDTSSVIYLNYLLRESSLSSASGYTKW